MTVISSAVGIYPPRHLETGGTKIVRSLRLCVVAALIGLWICATATPVLALSCPAGFVEIADTLSNPIGLPTPTPFAGSLVATLTYNTSAAGADIRGTAQNIPITAGTGAIDFCAAPGFYSVTQTSNGTTLTSSWIIPTSGGPYQLIGVPTGTVTTNGLTVTSTAGINFLGVTVADTVLINGTPRKVASVASATSLQLTLTAGTQIGVSFSDGPIERLTFPSPFPGNISIPGPIGPRGPSGGGGSAQCSNTVAFSSTPVMDFSICPLQIITLTGNVTPSIANPQYCEGITCFVVFIQGSSMAYSVTWPSNVKGGLQLGGQLSKLNTGAFVSDGTNLIGIGALINQ